MREEAIPILKVEDAAEATAWYGRLGFAKEWEHRFGPGLPAFVSVARGEVRLFFEHEGDARPDTLVYLRVAHVDAAAAEFGVAVEEAPWAQEIELENPDGNRLRVAPQGLNGGEARLSTGAPPLDSLGPVTCPGL